MRLNWLFGRGWRLATMLGGVILFLGGCDPTTRTTIENGIIQVSTSFLAAFFRAAIDLAQDPNSGL